MGLRGEVQDCRRLVIREDTRHRGTVRDVGLDERHARVRERPLEARTVAGVGQLVDDNDGVRGAIEGVSNS